MSFRITTGMMMNSYKYNLSKSTARMDSARNTVLTERKYNSYAEDPASAAHEWRIRRSITRNAGYLTSNTEAYSRMNTAWATLATIDDKILNYEGGTFEAIKRALNEPTGEARITLGGVLKNLAESFVYSLNGAKYGDHFLFSGNDEMNVPFSWDGGKLLYRGIPVDSGGVTNPADDGSGNVPLPDWAKKLIPINTPQMSDPNLTDDDKAWVDYYRNDAPYPSDIPEPAWSVNATLVPKDIPAEGTCDSNWEEAWAAYYRGVLEDPDNPPEPEPSEVPEWLNMDDPKWLDNPDWPDYPKEDDDSYDAVYRRAWLDYAYDQQNLKFLNEMNAEVKNMDLGMGLQEKTGNRDLLQSTAFNRAVPGISVTGYGVDEDGDPKNIVSIMMRLSKLLSACGEDGTFYKIDEDGNRVLDENNQPIADEETENEAYRLLDKFGIAHDEFNKAYSDVDTRGEYLQSNAERLVLQNTTLQEQLYDLSQIDPALAIEEFTYTYYCYSAALKIGTQLLSQSLIDYMG